MKVRLISHRPSRDSFRIIIKVGIKRLFRKEQELEYVGNGTVWHELLTWYRADLSMESVLSQFHERITHEEGEQ